MVGSSDFESIAIGYSSVFDPEKMAMLKRVFEKVCKDTGIFDDAKEEREALATHILRAALTEPIESMLINSGHAAVAKFRGQDTVH
jgi:hypothetical protein